MRPTLPLLLLRADGRPQKEKLPATRAIIDSGADRTTLPAHWAPLLGIDLIHDCAEEDAHTGAGKVVHYAFGGGLWVELLGEEILIPVVTFAPKLAFSALGREDFFELYLVLVDEPRKRFFLERHPAREEDDDDEFDIALAS